METHFDVLILGTGLTPSITAAALAKAGFKVLHVDQNEYYGGEQASLSHEELLQWSQSPPASVSAVTVSSTAPLPFSRSYSLSLAPALIPSSGPLIASLILSGVSRYGQFKLLDAVYIYRQDVLHRVPGNKEDIFKARDVSLIDKRKLMRFLQYAASEFEDSPEHQDLEGMSLSQFMREKFSLGDEAVEAILYALAYCSSPTDLAAPALIRLRKYLRSAGRYGSSPFLIGHYGGPGEIAQGFCRTCAVKGGTYILGRKIVTLNLPSHEEHASIKLEDVPDTLTADMVIAAPEYIPSFVTSDPGAAYACCIVIIDKPLSIATLPAESSSDIPVGERPRPDTVVVVFPPRSLSNGNAPNAVHVLQMGEATLSCPRGKFILYLCTPTDEAPEKILSPYLSAIITGEAESEAIQIEFSLFYTRRESVARPIQQSRTLVVPPLLANWTEIGDQAAQNAEALFWDAVKALTRTDSEVEAFWPTLEPEEDDEDDW